LVGVAAADDEEAVGRVEPAEPLVPPFVAFDRDRRSGEPVGVGELVVRVGVTVIAVAVAFAIAVAVAIVSFPRVAAGFDRC